jgi:bifunctional non-homologous end joining protein LigD
MIDVSRPDKVLFPETGFTKRDLVDYYRAVWPAIAPHLAGRPTTLVRFPDGVTGPGWFQANCRGPSWLPVAAVRGERGQLLRYAVFDELDAVVWAANQGTIELHPFLWRVDAPERPTATVFDLDPGTPAGLVECAAVALELRDRLVAAGKQPLVKTSGRKGLHVCVVEDGGADFAATKAFARGLAVELEREAPDRVVATTGKAERRGRVLIDWIQNDGGRSTIAPYSLRALPRPGVSTPLSWDEVEFAARERRAEGLVFAPADVLARLERGRVK